MPPINNSLAVASNLPQSVINSNPANNTYTSTQNNATITTTTAITSNGPTAITSEQSVFIGPNTELLNALGMMPLNNATEPIIRIDDSTSQLDLQFKMSKAVDFSFDLKYCLSNDSTGSTSSTSSAASRTSLSNSSFTQLKLPDIVNVKQYGYMIYFLLNLPQHKYGNYLFTVYASDDQSKAKTLPAVFTYLIKYEKAKSNSSSALFNNNKLARVPN